MASDIATVEAASASLVREYLSRKGLKSTLQQLDEELPRTENSISNRQMLMKHLNLDKLMKKNKEDPQPLKAMLEVMTKHFIHRRSSASSENNSIAKSESGSALDFSSTTSFGPQTDKPIESSALESLLRPKTATLSARREKGKHDLVVDEDVDGETMMGTGKSGVMANDIVEPPRQYTTKTQPSRPVSARQRTGMIVSNNDALSRGQRTFNKPLRVSVSQQQEQKKRDMVAMQTNSHSAGELSINGKRFQETSPLTHSRVHSATGARDCFDFSKPKTDVASRKQSCDDPPVSFEALLLKGEERANLLQKVGVSSRDVVDLEPEQSYKVETSSMNSDRSRVKLKTQTSDPPPSNSATLMQDLEFGDLDDHDSSFRNLELKPAPQAIQKPMKLTKTPSSPIDLKTAIALKKIVLGSPCQTYNAEWLLQAFTFCDMPDLKYGIVQKKGGPCGVLAAVQACLVQEMLFGPNKVSDSFKNINRSDRSRMLAFALSTILWRAGENTMAVVTVPSDSSHIVSSTKFKHDDITEKLNLYTFTNYEQLSSFLQQSISQFEMDGCAGVIQLIYSVILSRKSHKVRADFDVPEENTMIGSHGYCTQELVNLILTGKAVSNVFNDTIQLDSGTVGEPMILKGISGRADIGFLSLFEHYKSCQVGTYYKTPKNPVWVVCSESHFSVLFSPRRDLISDWKAEKRFELIYYDGLSRQQEEIRLTISTLNQTYKPPVSEEELVPPLEHCIHTKWPEAEIDWNGYEPIL